MKPIKGYVKKVLNDGKILVRATTGFEVVVDNPHKLRVLERVDIHYDFTRREVRQVRPHVKNLVMLEENTVPPDEVEVLDEHHSEDDTHEFQVLYETGPLGAGILGLPSDWEEPWGLELDLE